MSVRAGDKAAGGPQGFQQAASEQFDRAASAVPVRDRDITLAGQRLRLRFAGDGLESVVMAALGHREAVVEGTPDLTVCLWDSATSGAREFDLPASVPEAAPGAEFFGRNGPVSFVMWASTGMMNALDTESGTAFCWLPDGREFPWGHRASPLNVILHWWYQSRGALLVHAAAVALGGLAALLPGPSGSGKSTTALACARDPLRLVSDDLCLLEGGPTPRLHGIYRTARVAASDLPRFPGITAMRPHGVGADDKALIRLDSDSAARNCAKISAIMVPRVTPSPRARLVPISPAAALKALAPSTLFQFPDDAGMRARALRKLAAIVRVVSTYRLDLGTELDSVRHAVTEALSKAGS